MGDGRREMKERWVKGEVIWSWRLLYVRGTSVAHTSNNHSEVRVLVPSGRLMSSPVSVGCYD